MMKYIAVLFFLSTVIFINPNKANAINTCGIGGDPMQAHCGVWLCLAGGFPDGCELQKTTFAARLNLPSCSPLPSYASCGGSGNGSYTMGREFFHECREGFELVGGQADSESGFHSRVSNAYCINTDESCVSTFGSADEGRLSYGSTRRLNCDDYPATRRTKTRYIELQVDGMTYPRFYY